MLTSITPLGERGRGNRYGVTVTSYVVGSLLGGALTGLALGALGSVTAVRLPGVVRLGLAAAVCLLALLSDASPGLRLPRGHRQVDEDWLSRYRGWVYGGAFGFQLGLGVVTIVTSAATWAALAVVLLAGSPAGGLLAGAGFGLSRALPMLLLRRADDPARLRHAAARLERMAVPAGRTTTAALGAAAAVLLGGTVLVG